MVDRRRPRRWLPARAASLRAAGGWDPNRHAPMMRHGGWPVLAAEAGALTAGRGGERRRPPLRSRERLPLLAAAGLEGRVLFRSRASGGVAACDRVASALRRPAGVAAAVHPKVAFRR